MATQQDLQELLRLQTARKLPMKDAMSQIKSLQAVNLRSIQQIAEAPLKSVEGAIPDTKTARSLHNACKAHVKRFGTGATKRSAEDEASSSVMSKRPKQDRDPFMSRAEEDMTPQELEKSLDIPAILDEERIRATAVQTNRAPLVLAFAVELLRYTMPEQPPSSRLSLAQAVVSANSRSKAVSIGIDKGPSADEEGWGQGQPRIRVLGREIAVLKRGGYEWKGDEVVDAADVLVQAEQEVERPSPAPTIKREETSTSIDTKFGTTTSQSWTKSQSVSSKSSTFLAHTITLTNPSQRASLLTNLLTTTPSLRSATHNAWALRTRGLQFGSSTFIREESNDDGETGCGDFMLGLMREVDAVDVLVVMSRWYGGIMLGPDRWRLMRSVVSGALAERMKVGGGEVRLAGEAVWGLDLEGMRKGSGGSSNAASLGDMQIHRPEGARAYLFKSFASVPVSLDAQQVMKVEIDDETSSHAKGSKKAAASTTKKTARIIDAEKAENLALLIGALRMLFDSWADHITAAELDAKAWNWYVRVRPDVEQGPSGWGAKGTLKLVEILDLRRTDV